MTGIDLNILMCGHGTGFLQDYQNHKLGIAYNVKDSVVEWWPLKYTETFPHICDSSFSLPSSGHDIYIKKIYTGDINVYLIARIKNYNTNDNMGSEFSFAIFNSKPTVDNYSTSVKYVLDMTVANSSIYANIIV